MGKYNINGDKLRALIGRRVRHLGDDCTIIEVLEDELAVVVQCNANAQVVQPDQFGDPLRKVPATHTVSILASDGQELHPSFKELGIPDPRDIV